MKAPFLKPVGTIPLDMSGTHVTTAAYATVSASVPSSCSAIEVFNPSGSPMKIAIGAAAAEVDLPYTLLAGGSSLLLNINIAKAVRLSAKSLTTNVTTGLLVFNLFG